MKNKITFFRLSNSNPYNHFNENEKVDFNELQKLKWVRERIYKLSEKKYSPLSKKDQDNYEKIVLIEKEFHKKRKDYNFIPEQLFWDLTTKPSSQNLETEIYKDFYKKVYEETKLEIEEVSEILSQKIYNDDYYKSKEKIEKLNKKTETERIHIEDLDKINIITKKMNNDGWSIKQIEGIQSGISNSNSRDNYGYGYSFTDGIIIVWEK